MVKVGRIAGQYSKPRSKPTETRDGVTLPTYRGDSVNGFEFTEEARIPDPERLKRMYHASASTLNLVRAFTTGGYADLRQVHAWNQDFVKSSPSGQRYEALAREIDRALNFMNACGTDPEEFRTVEFFSSHEALLLDYESALTRVDSRTGKLYDVSGPHGLDRRAHPAAGRRAHRVRLAHPQPDRRQARPDHHAPRRRSRSSSASTRTASPAG